MAEKLDSILKSYVADGTATKDKLLGAAFVVVSKDGLIYQGSAGRTRVDPASPPFTPSSITWMASMSKLITTTTLMHLVSSSDSNSNNRLTLDEDLRTRVPELGRLPGILRGFATPATHPDKADGEPLLEPSDGAITLRQLLTHTAGLGVDWGDPDLMRWSRWVGRTANVGSCTVDGWTTPLKFAPGEGWYYGTGPDWAGQVLERVTGRRLGEYMDEHVLRPLGVDGTTGFWVDRVVGEARRDRYVPLAERDGETGELKEGRVPFPVEPPCESGGAGLYSNAVDYGRVMQELLRALDGEGKVIKQETAKEMFRPQLDSDKQKEWLRGIVWTFGSAAEIPEGAPVDHGIGGALNLEDVEGRRRKGSLLWSGMCNSRWWIDPETGIGAAIVVNVIPYKDATVLKMYEELEKVVYGELVPNWQASK